MFDNVVRLLDIPFAVLSGFLLLVFFKAFSLSAVRALFMFGFHPKDSGLYFAILEVLEFRDVVPESPHSLRLFLWFCVLAFMAFVLLRVGSAFDNQCAVLREGNGITEKDVALYMTYKELLRRTKAQQNRQGN